MGRRTGAGTNVPADRTPIDAPRQRLIRVRRYPLIGRVTNARGEVAGIAGDRDGRGRRRGDNVGGERAVRARRRLIGPTDRNDGDIRVHAVCP